jgi:GNAT superfamily N-acetyltransferase
MAPVTGRDSEREVEVSIRPYRPEDRARVRQVCYLTGYMGDRVDWLWSDAESFADVYSGYYTDAEPESAFVVEVAGTVEGYLLGCVDSSRTWRFEAVAGRHVVRRGLAFRRGTAAMVWRSAADAVLDLGLRRVRRDDFEVTDPRYPAHLHVDLMPVARGRGLGRRLVDAWFDRLRSLGVSGCHLQTFAENSGGIAFFESVGFQHLGDAPVVPGWRTRDGARMHVQAMVADLSPSPMPAP